MTIVVHPGEAVARRESMDEAGVVHHYTEVLAGEAMERGPIMLSWPHVAEGAANAGHGSNVVVHEFVQSWTCAAARPTAAPAACGFSGTHSARAAHEPGGLPGNPPMRSSAKRLSKAERFGAAWPWLDAYGATAPAEFFAVACEAYFEPRALCAGVSGLVPVLDASFGLQSNVWAECGYGAYRHCGGSYF